MDYSAYYIIHSCWPEHNGYN